MPSEAHARAQAVAAACTRHCRIPRIIRCFAWSARVDVAELMDSRWLEDHTMTDRRETEQLLRGLYAARVSGDLAAVYEKFSPDARFQIAGASHSTPVAVTAVGAGEYRPLLAIMIKTFKLSDEQIVSLVIDGAKAAVHWRVNIFSRLTGTTVLTELVDMIEIRNGRIGS